MKKVFYLAVGLFAFIAMASPTLAAKFEAGKDFSLPKDQTVSENFYAAGSNLTINGNVIGDSFLAGSNINVSGTTTQDLFVGGAAVNIFGGVGGDLRAAGSSINLNAPVGGEVLIAGAQVNISSDISKDVYAAGATVSVSGHLKGKLTVSGSNVNISGTVDKDVEVIAEKLTIGSGAVINGNLIYKAPQPAVIAQGATIKGETKYTQQEYKKATARPKNVAAVAGAAWLFKMILSVVAGLVLYFIFRKGITSLTVYGLTNFWKELLRGFIILVVLPIAMIVAAVTVIGLSLSFIAGTVYMLYLMLAGIGAGIILGSLVFKLFSRSTEYKVSWVSVLVGILLVSVLNLIPVLGWLFNFVFCLVAFGTLFNFSYRRFILQS